ncbi:MAG TPA: NAD(P)-binding domain-containing protein [Actinomycetes bacterium]|nr:NAD(P)-binding domain-containing protein [Actinomycetes bacterium]
MNSVASPPNVETSHSIATKGTDMNANQTAQTTNFRATFERETVETVIVGGGQCGLAVGYFLAKLSRSFVILDEHQRVGDCWRERYDSLRLYTPRKYDGLPGMPFSRATGRFPTGAEMADYLEAYASHWELPVRNGIGVTRVRRDSASGPFVVSTNATTYEASNVVVATGGQHLPYVPDFAGELDADIRQFHSSDYRNASQLQLGGVLVVGASHSGADLALESADKHETWLVGRNPGQVPFNIEGLSGRAVLPLLWFAANHVLTVSTPVGRKIKDDIRSHGGPLLRYKSKHLNAAGVHRVEVRAVGAKDGKPVLEDGQVLDVANVIWCTGFRRDFSWIDMSIVDDKGWPRQTRGVSDDVPGLYFAGLLFQHSASSMLVGGAGRDARSVAEHIEKSTRRVASAA